MGILIIIIIIVIIYASIKNATKKVAQENQYQPVTLQIRTNLYDKAEIDTTIDSNDLWVPKGKLVTIKNIEIKSGMIYVGKGLAGAENKYTLEPSLINPQLAIRPVSKSERHPLGYWPSYNQISEESRYMYLQWLSSGRKNANIDIGYVFIFFYGLERRLLYDTKTANVSREEINDIIIEIERLLHIFNKSHSFNRYASEFLDYSKTLYAPNKIKLNLTNNQNYGDVPFSLKYKLSYYCAKQKPIPPSWAFFWYLYFPYFKTLRTPAERCQKEFVDLFKIKYHEKFNEGLIIKEPKRRLIISYHPASSSFRSKKSITFSSLPDVVSLSKPYKDIEQIVDSAIDELDAYSRYLGRNPDDQDSFNALSSLCF